jgi:CBS domain-containing protein
MLCEEIMKSDVECLTVKDTVQTAAQKMRQTNIGFLPVCDNGKKVVGTVTDRDLSIRVLADNRPASTPVGDVMTREVVACRPKDDIQKAEQLMSQKKKSRILCTSDQGQLMGVISLSDIAQRDNDKNVAQTMRQVTKREAASPH